ncbi:hypothetical protein CSIM01_05291 [Colletotrichum simmondsii]|uniref:Uncharacterized protein n=1 Tax=Colletotrichum simmondsii TaxID=703756 RepID=A0A135TGV5_9PEZI|nr:hypothetical protein CSIM01_05291 [Colletotrichum simmondsii]
MKGDCGCSGASTCANSVNLDRLIKVPAKAVKVLVAKSLNHSISVYFTSSLLYLASLPLQPLTAPMMNPNPAPPRLGSPFDWDPSENTPETESECACASGACGACGACATTKKIVTSTQNTLHITHDNQSMEYVVANTNMVFATSTTTSLRQTASIYRGPSRQWRTFVFQPS